MKVCVISLDYKNTPIEVREKVHFYEKDSIKTLNYFVNELVEEALILSTCNRTEIYFISDNLEKSVYEIIKYVNDYFKIKLEDRQLVIKSNEEALKHLFYTAIGLESLIVGEDQILGQITDSQILAIEVGASKKYLNKIFREAITFAKWTKTVSSVSAISISISYMGVRKIEELTPIENKKALVVGVGEMGKLASKYLLERGANVKITNRTYSNSEKLAKELWNLSIVDFENFVEEIESTDILITATSSPHIIVKKEMISKREKPLYIMDLGLPRDVKEDVALGDNIYLFDIDGLQKMSDENLKKKKSILEQFCPEIEEKIKEIMEWWSNTSVDPIMESAWERCNQITENTLNYINRRTNLNHMEKRKVEMIIRAGINRAMREPLVALKNLNDSKEKQIAIKVMEEVYLK